MVKLLMAMLHVQEVEGNSHAVISIKEWDSDSFTAHGQRQEK